MYNRCRKGGLLTGAWLIPANGSAPLPPRTSSQLSELQLAAARLLWLYHRAASLSSWIEFNESAAIGKAAGVINLLTRRCLPLSLPSLAVALAQLYKYHHQSSNAVSGKIVWKQHYAEFRLACYSPLCHFSSRMIIACCFKVVQMTRIIINLLFDDTWMIDNILYMGIFFF